MRQLSRNKYRLHCCQIVKEHLCRLVFKTRTWRFRDTESTDQLAGWSSLALACCVGRMICFGPPEIKRPGSCFLGSFQNSSPGPLNDALERSYGFFQQKMPVTGYAATQSAGPVDSPAARAADQTSRRIASWLHPIPATSEFEFPGSPHSPPP